MTITSIYTEKRFHTAAAKPAIPPPWMTCWSIIFQILCIQLTDRSLSLTTLGILIPSFDRCCRRSLRDWRR